MKFPDFVSQYHEFNEELLQRGKFQAVEFKEDVLHDEKQFKHQESGYRSPSSHDMLHDELFLFFSPDTWECHVKDTKLLMHDGSIRAVQDIREGDLLMGDDSTPRRILSIVQRFGAMYDVSSKNNRKITTYIMNAEHILSVKAIAYPKVNRDYVRWFEDNQLHELKRNEIDDKELERIQSLPQIVEMSVSDYIKYPYAHELHAYRVAIEFESLSDTLDEIDPYVLGLWLGGEQSNSLDCYCIEMRKRMHEEKYGLQYVQSDDCMTFREDSEFMRRLKCLNIRPSYQFIPDAYKYTTRQRRLQLLAGIIDVRGILKPQNYYSIMSEWFTGSLCADIQFLCESLGFVCVKSRYCILIKGAFMDLIPVACLENKCNKNNPAEELGKRDKE